MSAALSIPTTWSRGPCSTSSARSRPASASAMRAWRTSSRNSRRMRKPRPARLTSASPSRSICGMWSAKLAATWLGSQGAPMVATARTLSTSVAARITAAPPSECPTSRSTGWPWPSRWRQAATRSPTLEVKWVLANSPSECPSPVKSKRSTANPSAASRAEMRRAAAISLPQVKQWAKTAVPRRGPSAGSSRPASICPSCPGKVSFCVSMPVPPWFFKPCMACAAPQRNPRPAGLTRL